MEDKLVTVATFTDYIGAELAKQLLADHGIEAVATGEVASTAYSGMPAVGGYCRLETIESQAQRAREILKSEGQQEQ